MSELAACVTELRLFPTTALSLQFEDAGGLNDQLYRFFTDHEAFQDPEYLKHGDAANLLDLEARCPALGRVREMFVGGLARWLKTDGFHGETTTELFLFSNFARKGEYTLAHNHVFAHVAGVYYVRVPGAAERVSADDEAEYWTQDNGALILHDPRFNANLLYLRSGASFKKIFPRAGQMVLFPGYVWHSVTPHQDAERRLSIACNFWIGPGTADNPHRFDVKVD